MGTDYAEKEREFVDSLAEDTGRGLDQWMQAIATAGHTQRNDIIDWLRLQGFAFPKASWLERIHHNAGRLIYADDRANPGHTRRLGAVSQIANVSSAAEGSLPADHAGADAVARREDERSERQMTGPVHHVGSSNFHIAQFLLAAKGLKPLAEFVLREIEAAVPGTSVTVAAPYLTIAAPAAFAALHPAPKELRLYADFGAASVGRVRKADASAARGTPPFPEVLVINDARQIDAPFRDLIASAYTRSLI